VAVDIETQIVIERPRAEVAAYAAEPGNATEWYEHIKAVDWKTDPPLAVGSQICFAAYSLGKRVEYVYEVTDLEPGTRFVMRTAKGPYPMETAYRWQDEPGGGTRMFLRNRGEPHGLPRFTLLFLRGAMRRANRKDLRRLKALLEAR
jgi:uncharacterized membrane protein